MTLTKCASLNTIVQVTIWQIIVRFKIRNRNWIFGIYILLSGHAYTMTMQMVDIFILSFYLLATYQPFASPLYIVRNLRTSLTNLITYWVNIRGISNPMLINGVNKLMTNNIRSTYNCHTFMDIQWRRKRLICS